MEKGKIGVAISTRNRYETFRKCFDHYVANSPLGMDIVVVDDASDIRNPYSSYRFRLQAGIARTKNKCIELLYNKGCEHIFLSDDDCYPTMPGWSSPYIYSGHKHLQLSFEKNSKGQRLSHSVHIKKRIGHLIEYAAPNGCFYYIHRDCIDKVGGMRTDFGIWGMEHQEYSQRIHNAGLTTYPYLDIANSMDYFHVCDYYNEVGSSVPQSVRIEHARKNQHLLNKYKNSNDYVPFTI